MCAICCGFDSKKSDKKKKEKKAKDPKAVYYQNRIMCKIICAQWPWILLACPWMFIGAVGDFAFPDLIGRLVNAMRDYDEDKFKQQMTIWCGVILLGALGTALN